MLLSEEDSPHLEDLNRQIMAINLLITQYNRASGKNKTELLMELYQAHNRLDASAKGVELAMTGQYEHYSQAVHQVFIDDLKQEFHQAGVPSFKSSAINAWEIEHLKSDEHIPSPIRFAKMTRPVFWARLKGETHSVAALTAIRLLGELSQSSIKENTKENYLRLIQLKESIRELLAVPHISSNDQLFLRGLIGTINGRISDILENNPSLKKEVEPPYLPFADELANASYESLQDMTTMLHMEKTFDGAAFHAQFDDQFPSLKDYIVSYLGGANAKNYLLTDPISQARYVLKVTPNMGSNRQTIERLQQTAISNNMPQIFASREGIFSDVDGRQRLNSIEITEFCPDGDILSYGSRITDPEEKMASAWSIYSQMSDILIHFGANNALFPDMKPTNFLITEEGKVVIADTKSFVDTSNGIFDPEKVNESQYYLYTPGFEPPELRTDPYTSTVDGHHAYLMGLSLYTYLSDIDLETVTSSVNRQTGSVDPSFFTFSHPIFSSPRGAEYKTLIQGLLEHDPEKRLSLTDAKQQLQVIQQGIKAEQSPFHSKIEAYFYAIHHVMELQKIHDNPVLTAAIRELKILTENHEQDPAVAAHILESISTELEGILSPDEKVALSTISHAMTTSAYQQSLQEKYDNPLGRRLESRMQIELLQHPTPAMMNPVAEVSRALLNVFAQIEAQEDMPELLAEFAKSLTSGKNPMGFGSQPQEITLDRVKEILTQNRPEELNQILFIQFLFAMNVMRRLGDTVTAPHQRVPTGKLLEIIQEYNDGEYRDNPEAFFDTMDYDKLVLISNTKIYNSDLFTAESGRGRKGELIKESTSQMGIMLRDQSEAHLPTDPSSWTPDAKYQAANLDSIYVRDLIENDAVYVAGPSGMTSLFLNIMEMYGNLPSIEDKQNYFAAVSAYMVSGGLHSLHEVLGPAQYALDLIPGYNVTPPEQDAVAKPPNFHQFYQQQMERDPQFTAVYESGWDKLMADYAHEQHMYVHRPLTPFKPESTVQKAVAHAAKPTEGPQLNDAKATIRLIDILNKASMEHISHVHRQSTIQRVLSLSHTSDSVEINKVTTLLEKARMEHSLSGVSQLVQAFTTNQLRSDSGALLPKNNNTKKNSFIGYLLNELKKDPELVAYINQQNQSGQPLVLDQDTDYTQSNAHAARVSAWKTLQILSIYEEPEVEHESTAKMKQFKSHIHGLRNQVQPKAEATEDADYRETETFADDRPDDLNP